MYNAPAYLKDTQACSRYGVSRSTWWRWLAERRIPQPVKIGPRATRWRMADLELWEADQTMEGAQ
ncbi:helix-turn-helix domain-containing protein [Halomonas stenophila]|uniref:helix-turn-helix transcriptional regulator n=1 Tax=Halomonas stenophila TaxID=795312 RepID=UPI001620B7C0